MSINLMAYPMAFLIAPEKAKNEQINEANNNNETIDKSVALDNLKQISVLTNLQHEEIISILPMLGSNKTSAGYTFPSGLQVKPVRNGKYYSIDLFGLPSEELQSQGEKLFNKLDEVAKRNTRLIENSNEIFYYHYNTTYREESQIYTALKSQGAENIYSTEEGSVIATLEGKEITYKKLEGDANYTCVMKQKITIVNIGMNNSQEGINVNYAMTNLKIKTNIKKEELKPLLREAKQIYYEVNHQTPLKNSSATLNWHFTEDDYCIAEFSGANNEVILKEAEILFRLLDKHANRDVRYINDVTTATYTYNTNYTDKDMLIKTLEEHCVKDLAVDGDMITCNLYGMDLMYYKKAGSKGYSLEITRVTNKSECESVINDLNEEYALNIQDLTYNKIKERLEQENLRLESEEVLEDNSIILTIEV